MRRIELAVIGAIVILTALCRVPALMSRPPLDHDEAISQLHAAGHAAEYAQAQTSLTAPFGRIVAAQEFQRFLRLDRTKGVGDVARSMATLDIHPPAYFVLLRLWEDLLGETPRQGALLSFALSLVALLLFAALALRVLPPGFAALAVALFASCEPLFLSSILLRQYMLLCVFGLGWALALVVIVQRVEGERTKAGSALAAAVCGVGALYTWYLALFSVAAGVLGLATARGRRRLALSAAIAGAIAVMFLPLAPTAARQMAGSHAEGKQEGGASLAHQAALNCWEFAALHVFPLPHASGDGMKSKAIRAALVLALLAATGLGVAYQWRRTPLLIWLLTMSTVPIPLLVALQRIPSHAIAPGAAHRYLLLGAAFLCLVIASGLAMCPVLRRKPGLTMALGIVPVLLLVGQVKAFRASVAEDLAKVAPAGIGTGADARGVLFVADSVARGEVLPLAATLAPDAQMLVAPQDRLAALLPEALANGQYRAVVYCSYLQYGGTPQVRAQIADLISAKFPRLQPVRGKLDYKSYIVRCDRD